MTVRLEPWDKDDFPLLEWLLGDPRMTEHLRGPESHEKLVDRQGRYERLVGSGKGRMRCNDWRLDLFAGE